ncbi:O-acetyl-ADP-ribose deacetylase [Cohnella sp. GCM10012308]|uniref:O-acetyl-ADP-ribose deacetylase n=1 Tax=Cohnella sp. GCM10012308 TaxID=3317329 RepID=UPI00360A6B52
MNITMNGTMIEVIQGDITRSELDCIVNAANTSLLGGGGVDGAIHRAGGKQILEECIRIRNKQGGCAVGEAVITTGGNLQARYVIHTVGPVWQGGAGSEDELLGNCYRNALSLAAEHGIRTIAFPNISTGIYGYPKARAADVALKAIAAVLDSRQAFRQIRFVCFDQENYDLYARRIERLI